MKNVYPFFVASLLLTSNQIFSLENDVSSPACDKVLPTSLVLKISELPSQETDNSLPKNPSDGDFHVGLMESDLALIWTSQNLGNKEPRNYLCGALYSIEDKPHQTRSLYDQIINILSSKYKMISEWLFTSRDHPFISPRDLSDVRWENVIHHNEGEKWKVCGVHKKEEIPIHYYLRKQDQKVWVTKEEALKLAMQGELEVMVLPQ